MTYCLVVDDSLPVAREDPIALYKLVHECWRAVLAESGPQSVMAPDSYPMPSPRDGPFFCFEKPGRTDLIVDERKLLGSAQRRIPGRVMQHGSLLLGQRYAAHPGADLGEPPADICERWIDAFIARIAAALALAPVPATWTNSSLSDVAERRQRYAGDEWTRKR